MPDLLTHSLVPYFLCRLQKLRDVEILLLGLILPDILSRPFYYLLYKLPSAADFTAPMHSPSVVIAYCLLVSFLFHENQRRRSFFLLTLGSIFHLALDYLQINYDSGYYPLFPFSLWRSRKGLFWPEDSLAILPPVAALFLLIVILRRLGARRHRE